MFSPLSDQGLTQSEAYFCLQPGTKSHSWHVLKSYCVPDPVLRLLCTLSH